MEIVWRLYGDCMETMWKVVLFNLEIVWGYHGENELSDSLHISFTITSIQNFSYDFLLILSF